MTTAGRSPLPAASRVRNVKYAVRDVVVLADKLRKEGRRMHYLNIGDPNIFGWRTPDHVVGAAAEAMQANHNGYAPSDGIEEAITAIEADAKARGIHESHYTWIGSGCSEAIDMALTALLEPGENVLTPSPGYPLYTALLAKLDAENRPYYLDEENDWQPDVEDIASKIDAKTRAIVVINPNNPTGSVASRETLEAILDLAIQHDLVVFADEIYDRILFKGQTHIPLGSLREEATVITLGGLSKNWVAPGWRIGWGMVTGDRERIAPYIGGIQQLGRARLSANHPEQYAIKPALEGSMDHLAELVPAMEARADLAMTKLNAIPGISLVRPGGAFYAYPKIEIDGSDTVFCAEMMKATGVVVVPGEGFGQKPGTHHFRVVFLPNEQILEEAFDAIGQFMTDWQAKRSR